MENNSAREEKRLEIFNTVLLGTQLGILLIVTYGDFLNQFKRMMEEKLESYTEEDERWAFEHLEKYEKNNKPKKIKKKGEKTMKFVAFLKPSECWDGLDWIYKLMEDRENNYMFFLIEAKTAEKARELAAEEFYKDDMRSGGAEYIVERAFQHLCDLEYEDEEILDYFGEKDGQTVLEFYARYGYEEMFEDRITFYNDGENKHFTTEDREKFFNFDPENLKKLYKGNIRYDILMMPIAKELVDKDLKKKK